MWLKNIYNYTKVRLSRIPVIFIITSAVILFSCIIFVFRNPYADETHYLAETNLIANLLGEGKWFGNYLVGMHGFLFKLPVAILFMIFGRSEAFAYFSTLVFAILAILLYEKVLVKTGFYTPIVYSCIILLISSHQFITTLPTYLREIPVLFTVLVFVWSLVTKKNLWIQGICLYLIFEAKEHVFFSIIPGVLVYTWVEALETKGPLINKFRNVLARCFSLTAPVLTSLLLMFFSGIYPLNIHDAYILNLIDTSHSETSILKNIGYMKSTQNSIGDNALQIGDVVSKVVGNTPTAPSVFSRLSMRTKTLLFEATIPLRYVVKIVFPRTFGFLAIPLFIMVPAVYISLLNTIKNFKKRGMNVDIKISFIVLLYLVVYILHDDHGRYLFPIAPLIYILFANFLIAATNKAKAWIFALSIILSSISLFFEINYIAEKIILYLILALILAALYFRKNSNYIQIILILFLSCVTAVSGVAYLFSYEQNGQIMQSILWGRYKELSVITQYCVGNHIWIGNAGWDELPNFFKNETYIPTYYVWTLNNRIYKYELLKTLGEHFVFTNDIVSISNFRGYITNNKIDTVCMTVSTIKNKPFINDSFSEELSKQPWLIKTGQYRLKNKTLYTYRVSQ